MKANPDPNCCLGVFGLSLYTTERDLREVFSKYGPLADVSIVYDQQSRRSRGFAFVYFETREDAKEVSENEGVGEVYSGSLWLPVLTDLTGLVKAYEMEYPEFCCVYFRRRNVPTGWSWMDVA